MCVCVFRNRRLEDSKPSESASGEHVDVQPADVVVQSDHREDVLCRVRGRRKGHVPGTVALSILDVFPTFSSHNYPQPRSFSLASLHSPSYLQYVAGSLPHDCCLYYLD